MDPQESPILLPEMYELSLVFPRYPFGECVYKNVTVFLHKTGYRIEELPYPWGEMVKDWPGGDVRDVLHMTH